MCSYWFAPSNCAFFVEVYVYVRSTDMTWHCFHCLLWMSEGQTDQCERTYDLFIITLCLYLNDSWPLLNSIYMSCIARHNFNAAWNNFFEMSKYNIKGTRFWFPVFLWCLLKFVKSSDCTNTAWKEAGQCTSFEQSKLTSDNSFLRLFIVF